MVDARVLHLCSRLCRRLSLDGPSYTRSAPALAFTIASNLDKTFFRVAQQLPPRVSQKVGHLAGLHLGLHLSTRLNTLSHIHRTTAIYGIDQKYPGPCFTHGRCLRLKTCRLTCDPSCAHPQLISYTASHFTLPCEMPQMFRESLSYNR